jgi:MaoC like domain
VEYQTRPEQGAIYRLSGEWVQLYIDPEFARKVGYPDAFLHGLCIYDFVGRAILHSICGGDPANFKGMTGRFADQVFFGGTIIAKIWRTAPGQSLVQALKQKAVWSCLRMWHSSRPDASSQQQVRYKQQTHQNPRPRLMRRTGVIVEFEFIQPFLRPAPRNPQGQPHPPGQLRPRVQSLRPSSLRRKPPASEPQPKYPR